jgi:DDE family transposase
LQAVSRDFLVQLARRTPLLPGAGAVTFIDVDSLLRRVYGKKKQGVGFGHAKVGGYKVQLRGYNPLVATISTPDAAPVIAATQLRAGNAGSARGAAALIAEAIATTKAVLAAQPQEVSGEVVVRADSAFYSRKVIRACRRAEVRFSVTIRVDKKVRAAIDAIPADAWVEIAYPQPIWDDERRSGNHCSVCASVCRAGGVSTVQTAASATAPSRFGVPASCRAGLAAHSASPGGVPMVFVKRRRGGVGRACGRGAWRR